MRLASDSNLIVIADTRLLWKGKMKAVHVAPLGCGGHASYVQVVKLSHLSTKPTARALRLLPSPPWPAHIQSKGTERKKRGGTQGRLDSHARVAMDSYCLDTDSPGTKRSSACKDSGGRVKTRQKPAEATSCNQGNAARREEASPILWT